MSRSVLVTGGNRGIGKAIAEAFAAQGDQVAITYRSGEPPEGFLAVRCDVTDAADVDRAFAEIEEAQGPVEVLVANAGITKDTLVLRMSDDEWSDVIETNLTGTWNMTQVFGSRMLDGRGGSITQVIAVIGRGFPGLAHTAAARAGVAELSRTLAYEWGPRVRMNCVAPGPVSTAAFETTYDEGVKRHDTGIPLIRMGTPQEVAHAVVFLASPAASYITGEVLYVAGGQQLQGRNQALLDEAFEERKRR